MAREDIKQALLNLVEEIGGLPYNSNPRECLALAQAIISDERYDKAMSDHLREYIDEHSAISEATFGAEEITPDMARGYIAANLFNRPLSEATVRKYARLMDEGKWHFNGESVQFAHGGYPINGQHRFHAIVRHGKPVKTAVARGIKGEHYWTIDKGMRRSSAQSFAMKGVKDPGKCHAAVVMILSFEIQKTMGGTESDNSKIDLRSKVPEHAPLEWLETGNNQDKLEYLRSVCMPLRSTVGHESALMAIANEVLDSGHSKSTLEHFLQTLHHGANLEVNDPVLVLRDRLVKNKASKKETGKRNVFGFAEVARFVRAAFNNKQAGLSGRGLQGQFKINKPRSSRPSVQEQQLENCNG